MPIMGFASVSATFVCSMKHPKTSVSASIFQILMHMRAEKMRNQNGELLKQLSACVHNCPHDFYFSSAVLIYVNLQKKVTKVAETLAKPIQLRMHTAIMH